jgi:hypothetical protein
MLHQIIRYGDAIELQHVTSGQARPQSHLGATLPYSHAAPGQQGEYQTRKSKSTGQKGPCRAARVFLVPETPPVRGAHAILAARTCLAAVRALPRAAV